MKTLKNTIEIQQACLEAIKPICNAMEAVLARVEKKGLLKEEPTLVLEPYNDGYILKADYLHWDYRNDETEQYLKLRTHLYIQPCNFFETYLEDGQAYLEYSLLTPNADGSTSGRTKLGTITDLKQAAANWGRKISTQLNNL